MKNQTKNFEPTKIQEERVLNKVFNELEKSSRPKLFINFVYMKALFKNKLIFGSFVMFSMILFIGIPLLALTIDNSLHSNNSVDFKDKTILSEELNDEVESPTTGAMAENNIDKVIVNNGVTSYKEDTQTTDSERAREQKGYFILETSAIRERFNDIKKLASDFNGYIVSSNYNGGKDSTASVVIRIPAEKFDAALEVIRGMDVEVLSENVTTIDKQNELTETIKYGQELDTKIAEKEAALKNATGADKTAIENELTTLRSQKESNNSKLESINKDTMFSTLEVNLKVKHESSFKGDWATIPRTIKTIIVFWVNVFVIVSIPIFVIVIVVYLFKKFRKK